MVYGEPTTAVSELRRYKENSYETIEVIPTRVYAMAVGSHRKYAMSSGLYNIPYRKPLL